VLTGYRELYNEESHNLYSHQILLDGQMNEDEMHRACTAHGQIRNANNILVGKSQGKRPLGKQAKVGR
jgi:hypothetical protein